MKKLLWAIFGIILVVFGAISLISIMDWNHYKVSISSLVKDQTGYILEFNGPIKLQVFPKLHFNANDVRIKNKPGFKAQNLAVLKSINFKADILPLLRGKIKISEIDLIEPMFYVESHENGEKNWASPSYALKNKELDHTLTRDDTPIDLHIKTLTIEKGYVSYADLHTGATKEIKDINIEGSLDLPQQSFKFKGHLKYQDYLIKCFISSSQNIDKASSLTADVRVLKGNKDFGTLHWKGTVKDDNLVGDVKLEMLSIPDILKDKAMHNKLSIASKVKGNKEKINFSSLNFHSPSVQGTGSASLSLLDDTPKLEAHLSIPILTLGENKSSTSPSLTSAPSRSVPEWSFEKWNISFPENIDLLCTVNIDSFQYDAYLLRQLSTSITLKKGNLRISNFKANAYKGHVKGTCAFLPHDNHLTLTSDISIQDVDLGSLPHDTQRALQKAIVNAHLVLKTTANSTVEAIRRLSGSAHMDVKKGVIETVDIKSFIDHVKHVKGPQDIVPLMDAFKKKALVSFSSIKADFTLQNGKAFTNNASCESEDINALAKGVIDFFAWHMDMDAKIKIKSLDKIPAIEIKAVGDLSNPSFEINKEMLAKFLLTKTMGNVVNQAFKGANLGPLGDVIQRSIGIKKEPNDKQEARHEQSSQPSQKLMEVGKILKGLLG